MGEAPGLKKWNKKNQGTLQVTDTVFVFCIVTLPLTKGKGIREILAAAGYFV